MSPALFRAGLSYAQELDDRFGRRTTAAKMTDVPGHTLGMVPLLAEAGVKFLHLGVNTARPVPDVPHVFRWRAPDGSEIVVMYQNSYGATDFPEGAGGRLAFAHTNDNMGPQTVPQVAEVWRDLRRDLPGADIRASTLDAFGELLWDRRGTLSDRHREIGDSWIHGVASDPVKIARFLALQRLYDRFADRPDARAQVFGRDLALVAEHTWGVDIKSFLRDTTAWDRPAFEARRASDYRFRFAEAVLGGAARLPRPGCRPSRAARPGAGRSGTCGDRPRGARRVSVGRWLEGDGRPCDGGHPGDHGAHRSAADRTGRRALRLPPRKLRRRRHPAAHGQLPDAQ